MQQDLFALLTDISTIRSYGRVALFVIPDDLEYPYLFFSAFLARIGVQHELVRCDLEQQDEKDIRAQLEMSFLGQEYVVWLHGLLHVPERKLASWLTYIQQYGGPHQILCPVWARSLSSSTAQHIVLPEAIKKRECQQLYTFLLQRSLHPHELVRLNEYFTQHEKISLDQACLLLRYMQVVGRDGHEFIHTWMKRIVPTQSSLFALSQHLFARSRLQFMQQWAVLKPLYADQFWIAFWSEQFWRASWYIFYMKHKQISQAKKISFRLPYSFLQKDYRTYAVAELAAYNHQLYLLDNALKHGGSSIGIDLFLYRFFAI